MKRYFLVVLMGLLTVCMSACSDKQTTQANEYPAGTPETMQEAPQITDTENVQTPTYDEIDASVSEEEASDEETLTEFVRPSNEEIQTALKNAGFYTGNIDGKIGALSEKAIKDFQQQNGLNVDGKVGRKTWSILKKYLSIGSQTD